MDLDFSFRTGENRCATGQVVVKMVLKSVIEEGGGFGFLSDSRARPLMVKSVKLSPIKGNRNILVRSSAQV